MRRSIICVCLFIQCVRGVSISDELGRFIVHIDDAELFHGLPVGLQLIGRTQEEEAVIAMTEIVDKALKAYGADQTMPA